MYEKRVYPRVGGETALKQFRLRHDPGLSPRGRGNRRLARRVHADQRSIPAWAGKPRAATSGCAGCTVYPRVGGETTDPSITCSCCTGLSPRGRGNLIKSNAFRIDRGSIPAWAGKPASSIVAPVLTTVYPRVGGETGIPEDMPSWDMGLSPRGRGNLSSERRLTVGQGSIPAWAGKPSPISLTAFV